MNAFFKYTINIYNNDIGDLDMGKWNVRNSVGGPSPGNYTERNRTQ